MELVRASDQHSNDLIEYYARTPLEGRIQLNIEKKGNFFSQYKIQTNDSETFLLMDKNTKAIEGMATLLFRKAIVAGEEQTIGYATDLRVSKNRKAIITWAKHFMPILQEEKRKRDCNLIFSVVGERQNQAYNAFIRPRSTRRNIPRYYLYRKFDAVGIHGRIPFAAEPLDNIETRFANDSDLDALSKYISSSMGDRAVQMNYSPEVFLENLKRWSGLEAKDFLLAVDRKGNIVGCTALWDPQRIEALTPVSFDPKTTAMRETLQFFSYFRMTRRLSRAGEQLHFHYLSFLQADNPDIFYSLVSKAYDTVGRDRFIVYPHFEGNLLTSPPKSFFTSAVHCGLYLLVEPGEEIPSLLRPRIFTPAPDFELAFI